MMIYLYSFIPLLFLPVDTSSIRDRNFNNELAPSFGSRSDPSEKDGNSLKIVSNEPFIIQLQMPPQGEGDGTRRQNKDKDMKRKRPTKKRVSKIKPLRRRNRQRRDLQTPIEEAGKRKKLNLPKTPQSAKNVTKNSINRVDILKALSSLSREREGNKSKKHVENGRSEVGGVSGNAPGSHTRRIPSSPLVQMAYPSAPKIDKNPHKYTYKDLMSDRERLEKKIKYIRNLLNASIPDDTIRVRRRSESDRTANKIAKMFLTLSAVNGLHERLKSKCGDDGDDDDDDDDDDDGYSVRGIWGKERQENPSRKSVSFNEERYKVKKWIEHMKNKRSSSKTCPCMGQGHDEEGGDVFPLEQKLPKNYYLFQRGGSSEESSEINRDLSPFDRDRSFRGSHPRSRSPKAREDHEKKLKALAGRGRKFELPLDDLELYRMKAKQILQNAEEILDKIKEEEEKRVSVPNILVSQLKELTSRIQTDPRNNENDLIRKIQRNLGWGPTLKSPDEADGNTFSEKVRSFILDPYEKAKALTDESTKKLSSYLLRNLGELEEAGEVKGEEDEEEEENGNKWYFGEAVQKEAEKPFSESLSVEKEDDKQLKSKEDAEKSEDTVSSATEGGDKGNDSNGHQEEQFKKRMEEMMKEQEKKLNEFEVGDEIEEISRELGSGKQKQAEPEIADDAVAASLGETEKEAIEHPETAENYKTGKTVGKSVTGSDNASKESNSGEEIHEGENEKDKKEEKEEIGKEVLKEIAKEFDEKEKNGEAEIGGTDFTETDKSKNEKERKDANESVAALEPDREKSSEQEEVQEVVIAAAPPEPDSEGASDGESKKRPPHFGVIDPFGNENPENRADEIAAQRAQQSGETISSSEETILEGQEKVEAKADPEKYSAEDLNETSDNFPGGKDPVGVSNTGLNGEDGPEKETDRLEMSHREIEPQKVMEYADLIQEANEEKSLGKMKSNEEKDEERNEEEEALGLEAPTDGYNKRGRSDAEEEGIDDEETPGDDQVSKTSVGFEGATLEGENSKESFHENGGEALVNRNLGDDSKDSSREISDKHIKDETSEESEKPVDDTGTLLKEVNEEDAAPLKATMESSSEEKDEVADVDADTISEEVKEAHEEPENAKGSSEIVLKSSENKSEEEMDKYTEESIGKTGDRSGSDEAGETQDVDEEGDEKLLKSGQSTIDVEDAENVKEKDSSEAILEKENEENSDEGQEEVRLTAAGPSHKLSPDNMDEEEINDTISEGGNPDGKLGTEEEQDILSKASDGQDLENVKDKTEQDPSENSSGINEQAKKTPDWDKNADETVKAVLEEKGEENLVENEEEEAPIEVETVEESLRKEADETTEEAKEVSDDRNVEDGNVNEEVSLGVARNEEAVEANLNAKEDDDDQANERGDQDTDENLMRSFNNEDPTVLEDTDESPLRAGNTDVDVDGEREEKQDKSEGIDDDAPLRSTMHRNDEETLEDADETRLKAAMDKEEEILEDVNVLDKEEATLEDVDETSLKAAMDKEEETLEDVDETPLKETLDKKEETMEDGDETPLKAAMNVEEETPEDADETPLKAAMGKKDKDDETQEDADETPLQSVVDKEEETLEDGDETPLKAAMDKKDKDDETQEDADGTPLQTLLDKQEETLEDVDETPLKAAMDKEEESLEDAADDTNLKAAMDEKDKKEETLEDADETLKATLDKQEETLENGDETPLKATLDKDGESVEDAVDDTNLKAALDKQDEKEEIPEEDTNETHLKTVLEKEEETLEDSDETPLRAVSDKKDENEETADEADETPLKATLDKNEETIQDVDETPVGAVNTDNDQNEETPADAVENGGTLRSENPEKAHQQNEPLTAENPLRASSLEEFNNNINSEESPLLSSDGNVSDLESTKGISKDDSEESPRAVNTSDDVSNWIDETPLKSGKSFDGKEPGDMYGTLRKGSLANGSGELEEQAVSGEDDSSVVAAGPLRQRDSEEEIPSDSLTLHPVRKPMAGGKLKVPKSIAKIMKDLEGQEKEDITAIENLNPEKIDHIIDKIDEVEEQNKVTDEVDCRKECACAEDINARSRNRGRYEIVRDFLQWMKDLQLNRVLSDD